MTHAARLRSRVLGVLLACLGLGVLTPAPAGAQFGIFRGDRETKFRMYKDAANRFELELPEKDWRQIPLPASGETLAQFVHKDGPSFIITHVRMPGSLTSGERAAMVEGELERVRNQERATKDVKNDPVETRSGRGVLLRYYQVGRGPERVVQCTIDVGVELFRLNGVVPERLFARFEPIVLHMIESFKAPAEPPVPAK